MSRWLEVMEFVIGHEGGYVNHPDDPGGETNFGISKRSYPDEDIRKLTRPAALEIYRSDFWIASGCHGMPPPLDLVVMDYAVNSGVSRAVKALQRELGAKVDGEFGAKSQTSLVVALASRSPQELALAVLIERGSLFVRLACNRSGSENFLIGWMRRLRDNIKQVRG